MLHHPDTDTPPTCPLTDTDTPMIQPSIALNELAKRLTEAVPVDLQLMGGDMEKTFHAMLQASFSRMNLVSREEFEVQRSVLARTREQIEALEARVTELEQQILKG